MKYALNQTPFLILGTMLRERQQNGESLTPVMWNNQSFGSIFEETEANDWISQIRWLNEMDPLWCRLEDSVYRQRVYESL